MNDLGIFARTYKRSSLGKTLEAVKADGFDLVHFNFACAGLPSLPEVEDLDRCHGIRQELDAYGMRIVAVSGTFNAIHPVETLREDFTRRCVGIIESAPALGTEVVTLCTGTADPENMWRAHPDNDRPESWRQLIGTLEKLVPAAEVSGVYLGIEPETANVVNSAKKARALLDEMKTDRLKIILDGANLFVPGNLYRMEEVLTESVDLLGPDIAMIHAKDIVPEGKASQAAGTGCLDYDMYFSALAKTGFAGPIVLHNLEETEVAASVAFVRAKAERWLETTHGERSNRS